jgi:toxin ParE1/3/4
VKVAYGQAARDDVVRQFRYYLIRQNLPDLAIRFRTAVRQTIQSLQSHPLVGSRYRSNNHQLQNLRTWAVTGFEAIRNYYQVDQETLRIIRILHGKRGVKRILEAEAVG